MKKLIYISHAYGGKEENIKEIEEIIKKLYSRPELIENYCFISPVHNYECLYKDYDNENYYTGLGFCLDLLLYCDEMWVFGDYKGSKGVIGEIDLAVEKNIFIRYISSLEELEHFLDNKSYNDKIYMNPVLPREIKRNITLYTVVETENIIKTDDEFKEILKRKILYQDLSDAIDKLNKLLSSNINISYTITELEVSLDKLFDLSDNKDIFSISLFIEKELIDCEDTSDYDIVNRFMNYNSNKYNIVKRVINSDNTIFDGSKIRVRNKTIYKIYNTDAIINMHKFSGYILGKGSGNGVFRYPFNNKNS